MNTERKSQESYFKTVLIDIIKVLLFLVVFSTLFHNKLSALIDSVSDFTYHHYFFTSFLVLIVLAFVIEFDVFKGDHIKNLNKKLNKNSK